MLSESVDAGCWCRTAWMHPDQAKARKAIAVPLSAAAVKELGGWECVEMVRKYAHLSSKHLAEYVDHLSSLKVVSNDSGELATIRLRG